MMELSFDDKDFRKWLDKMVTDGRDIMKSFLFRVGLVLEKKTVENIKAKGLVDTGKLMQSFRVSNPVVKRDEIYVKVYSRKQYAAPLEFGTRPFWPADTYTFRKWVERKLGVPKNRVEQVAYLIRRKIAKRGIKARHYLWEAVQWVRMRKEQYVNKILESMINAK